MKIKFLTENGKIKEYTETKLRDEFGVDLYGLNERDDKPIFKRKSKKFLDKFGLRYSVYNLRCLAYTGMVEVKDGQIKKLKERGLIE